MNGVSGRRERISKGPEAGKKMVYTRIWKASVAGTLTMKGTGLSDAVGEGSRVQTKDHEGHTKAFYFIF